jgi:oxalate decarboxylase/phosphoglucose isomerase-like protein (cupin superfamily)
LFRKQLRFGRGFRVIPGSRSSQRHEIRNTGRAPLRTLNFYSPPAYRRDGNSLSRGKK